MKFGKREIPGDTLYKLCLRGDEKAWGYLRQFVYSVVVNNTYDKNDPELEDKTQMVLVHIRGKMRRKKFNPTGDFYSYVARTTINKATDRARSKEGRKGNVTHSLNEMEIPGSDGKRFHQFPSKTPTPEECITRKMIFSDCKMAIQRIRSERQKQAVELYLRLLCGDPQVTSLDDIVDILQVPKGTAASLISRGLDALKSDATLRSIFEEYFK